MGKDYLAFIEKIVHAGILGVSGLFLTRYVHNFIMFINQVIDCLFSEYFLQLQPWESCCHGLC